MLTMGISVVAGALTTVLAGLFLVFPPVTFFQKIGTLIMTTVAFSITFALTFFPAVLSVIGPEGGQGKVPFDRWWRRIKAMCTGQ